MADSEIINEYRIFAFENVQQFLTELENRKQILVAMNAEKILKNDSTLREIVNENIGYPDGIGAVMALKSKGRDSIRLPGAEMWLEIINKYHKTKSFYFIGATQEVIENTVGKVRNQFPDINIAGFQNGYLNEQQEVQLKEKLRALKPDVVFVAQGSPRQEFLMRELKEEHPALYMGLGGSFDVFCGVKKRAPKIFQDLGLEWLYRLMKEPTRISRQLVYIRFMFLLRIGAL